MRSSTSPVEALAARLALAAGDGAERVEPARDGGEKTFLAAHIRRYGPEQGRLRLIGAVRAPEPLEGGIRAPAGPKQVMHAQAD